MSQPLCIDLFTGLHGWAEGFVAEGWTVVGFDIEDMCKQFGVARHPDVQLVLQDVRTIHGSQFRHADMIVASSPCQEFSYRAMPWKRAKALGPPVSGMELFAQAARIQREASEAAGRRIPMIQENVRGAQPWVGKAQWHYGSYYLWGDVPALMPFTHKGVKVGGMGWYPPNDPRHQVGAAFNPAAQGRSFSEGRERNGGVDHGHRRISEAWRSKSGQTNAAMGIKQPGLSGPRTNGKGDAWFQDGAAQYGSKSTARKAASAAIAKIPFPLASHIARVYHP